ncbi:hypothetical protein [Streptomyces broussonetiae]|uniref:SIR2-like domain-containing protein n=1 Tax=Streptomyces broussonetiae TaxID=2686304 RepID=A0ABV5EDC8_9ACTN
MSVQALTEAVQHLRGLAPHQVLLWSGAGISVEGPASLPTGPELTGRVFDTFFEGGALDLVMEYHQVLGLRGTSPCPLAAGLPAARPPRLETALEAAARARGSAVPSAFALLDDVRKAQPNRLHGFAADHIARGGHHVTANFDTCVEKAYQDRHANPVPDGAVHHFHGSFANSPNGEGLGATLGRVVSGFPADEAKRLRIALGAHRGLLLLGYSGSDYFDVDRLVAALAPDGLRGLRVLWVMHSGHTPHTPASDPVPLQTLLRKAGAQVHVLCGPTAEVVQALADAWGLPPLTGPAPRVTAVPRLSVTDDERDRATFLLYGSLGLHREVRRLLREGRTGTADPAELLGARSRILWEAGRWNTLRRMWRAVPADGPRALARAERIGASLWAQGRLLPAWWYLRRHAQRAEPGRQDAYTLEETLGRVIEHMHRTPDLRPLARRLLRRTPAAGPPAPGPVAFRALHDVRDSLDALRRGTPRSQDHARHSTVWFQETNDLQGILNYRHRSLRDGYDPADPRLTDEALRDRYEQLIAANLFLGSTAGAWRTALLPGAHRVFPLPEYLHALFALQYGWWQRVRLLVWFLPRRARHRWHRR